MPPGHLISTRGLSRTEIGRQERVEDLLTDPPANTPFLWDWGQKPVF